MPYSLTDNASPERSSPRKPPIKHKVLTPDDVETTTSDYFGGKVHQKPGSTESTIGTNEPSLSRDLVASPKRNAAAQHDGANSGEQDSNVKPSAIKTRASKSRGRNALQPATPALEDDEDAYMKDADPRDDFVALDNDEGIAKRQAHSTATRKRKFKDRKDEESDDSPESGKASKKIPTTKKEPAKKKVKVDDAPESASMQAIYDSIPIVRPPSPPPTTDDPGGPKKTFDFRGGHGNTGPPPAAGSKEVPVGAENCLAGLSFVFTGLMESLSRDDGQALVKRYGGKVMTTPSSKTSFVVLGSGAGPKKIETIRKYSIRSIDEDGLFELIRKLPADGGDSKAASKFEEKKQAELQKVKEMAAEVDKEVKKAAGSVAVGSGSFSNARQSNSDVDLWTVKYAPTQITQICGNKAQVEKLQRWLRLFPKNSRTGFKLAGSDGSGVYRAVMIHGPPGIGKTTAAHLVAKLEGYDIVESNASDTRSKKLVEAGLKGVLSTTSLLGYFAGDGQTVDAGKKKLVLIMDEVDGMSAGDRGGVGALAAVCKKSRIPMILICNERKLPKMKPFDGCTYELAFRRPTSDQIRARIMTIGYREGLKLVPNVVDALIEGSRADIRQVVNMISSVRLDQQVEEQSLDFDRTKQMSKAWEKNVILRPWDIVSKIMGGGMFAASSKSTLNDKSELYFNDHEFSYLMLQENYLGTSPAIVGSYKGQERDFKTMELVEQAASSISEGDLIDRMIHGTQQQWSLMPAHAIASFVRPASFVAGSMAGHQTRFTQWLGKNSSLGKAARQVKEIQGHMRLRCSADRDEIRQQYLPSLWSRLVKKLEIEGKESVPEIIELMDSYFLTKDDWDAVAELGIGPMDYEGLKIETQSKATFTRL